MAKALKHMMVAEYSRDLESSEAVIVFDPGPMSVEKTEAFRKDLREQAGGARMKVIHNRTARRALEQTLFSTKPELLAEILQGRSAIAFGGDGPIPVAKVLRDWKRKFKPLSVKGGVAEGEVLDATGIEELADLPGVPQLRGMLLGAVIGSARGIAASLQGVYGGLARSLQARIDLEEEAGEGADGDGNSGDS